MQRLAHVVGRIMAPVDKVADGLVIAIFALMLASGFAQIFNRSMLNISLSWSEEFQRYCHIWLIFFTIPVAYRHSRHIGITYIFEWLGESRSRFLLMLIDVVWFLMGTAIATYTLKLVQVAQYQTSPGLDIPMSWPYAGMFVGGAYLAVTAVRMLLSRLVLPPADDQSRSTPIVEQQQ